MIEMIKVDGTGLDELTRARDRIMQKIAEAVCVPLDLLTGKPKIGRTLEQYLTYGDVCSDFDDDCWGISCKLSCWMYDPARGPCPFLTGEQVDEGDRFLAP